MILGMTLHPGEECTRRVEGTEHLIIAALDCRPGKYTEDSHPSSCLLIKHGGYEQVVCTLEKGLLTQQKLDLVLLQNEIITFMVEGTGTIYITGYTTSNSITFDEEGYEIGNVESASPVKEEVTTVIDARSNDEGICVQSDAAPVEESGPIAEESCEEPPILSLSALVQVKTEASSVDSIAPSETSEDAPLQSLKESAEAKRKESFMESMRLVGSGSRRHSEGKAKKDGPIYQPQLKTPKKLKKAKKHRKQRLHFKCAFCSRPFPGRYHLERHERTHTGDKPFSCMYCGKAYGDKSHLKRHMISKHDSSGEAIQGEQDRGQPSSSWSSGTLGLAKQENEHSEGPSETAPPAMSPSSRNARRPRKCRTPVKMLLNNHIEDCMEFSLMHGGLLKKEGESRQDEAQMRALHTEVEPSGREEEPNTRTNQEETSTGDPQDKTSGTSEANLGDTGGDVGSSASHEDGGTVEGQGGSLEGQGGGKSKLEDGAQREDGRSDQRRAAGNAARSINRTVAVSHQTGRHSRWYCTLCDMSFRTRDLLRAHKHVKSTCKCDECGMTFKWPSSLTRHRYRHTGERPFQCRFCDRRFTRKDKRNEHERWYHSSS